MRIQSCSPTLKPIEETPIVPVWIGLSELPWKCYYKDILIAIVYPIGKLIYLDNSTVNKTRGSTETT